MYALIANILAIIFVILGILVTNMKKPALMLAFYTILSNIVTAISSVAFLIDRSATLTISLRYLSTVMLTMTVLVTLFVLVPAGAGYAGAGRLRIFLRSRIRYDLPALSGDLCGCPAAAAPSIVFTALKAKNIVAKKSASKTSLKKIFIK